MAEQYAVSVIIPVYSTQKYLRECLDSVCQEAYFPRYEVLLVDDGSTDGSAEIMREYADRHPNVFALQYGEKPENRGLASARNLGLRHAHGRYVFFLDSDDAVRDQYIGRLYDRIVQAECDVAYAGYSRWSGEKVTPVCRPVLTEEGTMTGREFLGKRMDRRDDHDFVWCALYQRSLFTDFGVAFKDGVRLYEDLPFTLLAACEAPRVCAVPLYGYLYRQRPGSLVQDGIRPRDAEGTMQALEIIFGDPHRYLGDPVCLRYCSQVISMCLYYVGVLAKEKAVSPAWQRQFLRRLRSMIPWRRMYRAAVTPREKVKWWIWRIDPKLFCRIVSRGYRKEKGTK